MTASCGRIEARFTLTSNISALFETGSPTTSTTVTITAGNYYISTYLDAIEAQLNLSNWVLNRNYGEGIESIATGKIEFTGGAGTVKITFTDALFGQLLGCTSSFGFTSSHVADQHYIGVWLPAVVKFTQWGDSDAGLPITDLRQTVSPTGSIYSLKSNSYDVIDGLAWHAVSGRRTRKHLETTTGESFEYFMRNCQYGEHANFPVGTPIRLFWNADDPDDSSHYTQGTFLHPSTFSPAALVTGWTGRYQIPMPRLVIG